MIGSAIAPVTLLFMQSMVGWRGAFVCAAALGVVAARSSPCRASRRFTVRCTRRARGARMHRRPPTAWQLLLSPPILLNLVFFVVLSMVGGGLNQYLVVGLQALHGTPPAVGNTALTGLLAMSAVGVLVGGALAARTAGTTCRGFDRPAGDGRSRAR